MGAERILTTHVGSLPRPPDIVDLLNAKEHGEPYDRAAFDAAMEKAVDDAVGRQVAAGIDIVSDGEMSKISYATYIADRLSGFGGHTDRQIALDLQPYPAFRAAIAKVAGSQSFNRRSCIGDVAFVDRADLDADIAHFAKAVQRHKPVGAFLGSASPGLISAFQTNKHYSTHEAYLAALAAAMRTEYEAIAKAGFLVQVDCPDLAMARHTGFQDLSEAEFLIRAEQQVEALNDALCGVPADRLRMHVCWGNYEGPHDHDIALEKILGIVLKAKPQAILFEAANPRHAHEIEVWRAAKIPDDKVLVPGLIGSTSNYVEHPRLVASRIEEFAKIVGRDRVIAGTDCGFGTFAGIGKVDAGIAWAKLKALAEGAALATRRLWGG